MIFLHPTGQLSHSLRLFQKAVVISPNNLIYQKQARLVRLQTYVGLTEVQKLLQLFALKLTQVGRTLQLLGNYEAATQVFDGAIQQAPRDWDLWHNQGLCHMAAKDYERYTISKKSVCQQDHCNTSLVGAGLQNACNRQMG